MKTVHERLAWARKQAGFDDAAPAARAMDVPETTYRAHENGGRVPKKPILCRYAEAFGVSWSWLMTGEGEPSAGDARRTRQGHNAQTGRGANDELMRSLDYHRTSLDQGIKAVSTSGYTLALVAAEGLVDLLRRLDEEDKATKSRPTTTSAP